jgi:hypothetical protein
MSSDSGVVYLFPARVSTDVLAQRLEVRELFDSAHLLRDMREEKRGLLNDQLLAEPVIARRVVR